MSSVLPTTGWGECLVPEAATPRELVAEVRREMGVVPGWLSRVAPCPWLVRAFTSSVSKPWAYAPFELWDLIHLTVSQDNSCRYCFGVQRALLKIAGWDDARIARLERDVNLADLTRAERAAVEFARKLSRADPRPRGADVAQLREQGFAPPAVAEIAFAVAAGAFLNRASTFLALPIETELERFVDTPMFHLMRPVMAWRLRKRRQSPGAPPRNEGIGATVVAALGDSPSARIVRRIVDDAWSSPIVPRRTKALVLAVVAKALGCVAMERDARALLEVDGLTAADVDEVLANLGSPALDPREALLVPFARETVRYQSADIQRRVVAVTRAMTPEERLEVVGVLALANALCRLSVLLDAC